MNEKLNFLSRYPFEEHYAGCKQYLRYQMDWDAISAGINQNGVIYLDISDVIDLFPHLELDEDYQLICYLSREYHGIWGKIAAVHKEAEKAPIFEWKTKKALLFLGIQFELPDSATPPMEVIYHDGTDEGFLEAVLFAKFLRTIPFTCCEQPGWNIIMNHHPSNLRTDWDVVVDISDWTPRRVNDSIIAFERVIENGFGSSDGRDRIYLTQFDFQKNLRHYHFMTRNRRSIYKNKIDDDKRYNKNRHCCVFGESSVLIATEKSKVF